MNEVEKFLENKLSNIFNINNDRIFHSTTEKARYITDLLCKKKFRKAKISDNTKKDIYNKVLMSIEGNIPLYFVVCFGGYKHFWNKSYPKVDYAELFNLIFFSEYFAPILKIHKPGVILDYGAEDIVITLMDNFPKKDIDNYAQSFRDLISFYSKQIPANFKIIYTRNKEKYNEKDLLKIIFDKLPSKIESLKSLSKEEKERELQRSRRSIKWDGEEDWRSLNEIEKEEKFIASRAIELLYYENEPTFIGDYYDGGNHIPIVLSWGLSSDNEDVEWLTLGSTFSSAVDFWTGRGILEKHTDKIVPRIVSRNQYEKIKNKVSIEEASIIPLDNFQTIEIYNGTLHFN